MQSVSQSIRRPRMPAIAAMSYCQALSAGLTSWRRLVIVVVCLVGGLLPQGVVLLVPGRCLVTRRACLGRVWIVGPRLCLPDYV
jgi:hypothetical protein